MVTRRAGTVHVSTAGIGRIALTFGRVGDLERDRRTVELSDTEARALANIIQQTTTKDSGGF